MKRACRGGSVAKLKFGTLFEHMDGSREAYLFFVALLCHATDTITRNNFLRDGDILVSSDGNYAVGFFSPGNSPKRYIGVWYNKIPELTIIWVANRDNPIQNSSSGVVKVDERGNFGNLVLCDEENMGDFLWQSFDYPTDTRLPGMKTGMNLKLGSDWSLRSWKSPDDPSTGDFTYEMSRTGSVEMVIKKGSQKIWRTGKWNGRGFNGGPGFEMKTPSLILV
ncbi:hypothetical protein Sjap_025410 [Stephania japonica]|uniref:Bulb-type lectin domain-containing protein n=1 Tax=Stephania japonica TaxID=461633 RepID=A0AAP0E9H9_9MAGN